MARTREEASSTALDDAIDRLMRENLVDRPYEPVAEHPRGGQAACEQGELHPREEGAEPTRTSPVPVEALGPVEVQESDTRAGSPEPPER
jgi:hypothetical protein